jgi:hypothetical protein
LPKSILVSECGRAEVSHPDSDFDVYGNVSSFGIFSEKKQALLNVNIRDTVKAL